MMLISKPQRWPTGMWLAALTISSMMPPAATAAIMTISPLVNPGFEDGTNGWDNGAIFNRSGAFGNSPEAFFSATEGNDFFGRKAGALYRGNAVFNAFPVRIGQRVDVSMFSSIDSVTFGADYFGISVIEGGSATVDVQSLFTRGMFLEYRDENLASLGRSAGANTDLELFDGLAGYMENDARRTDSAVPAGTKTIDVIFNPTITIRVPNGPDPEVFLRNRYGIDDVFLSVTGSDAAAVPEPSSMMAMAVIGVSYGAVRRRRSAKTSKRTATRVVPTS